MFELAIYGELGDVMCLKMGYAPKIVVSTGEHDDLLMAFSSYPIFKQTQVSIMRVGWVNLNPENWEKFTTAGRKGTRIGHVVKEMEEQWKTNDN